MGDKIEGSSIGIFWATELDGARLYQLPTELTEYHALTYLLAGVTETPTTCEFCPFGSIEPDQEVNVFDRAEAVYRCDLLPGRRIWGESPLCTRALWQAEAQKELYEWRGEA